MADEIRSWQLYLAPGQRHGGSMTGYELDKHIKSEGLMDDTFSLNDPLVQGWIADPKTYPEEFKDKIIYLWKSQNSYRGSYGVMCLMWGGGERVGECWARLDNRRDGNDYILLASNSALRTSVT